MIKKILQNWKSGLTVSLVSIPLSISLAVASQASPIQGIITGIWAGFIAALFGGSDFNIIGPTGALSGIIASFALTQGSDSISMLAIVTGLIILCAYVLHFEHYLIFIPSNVIHGFTLGIAFIIGLNQLNFALGLSDLQPHKEFILNVKESLMHMRYAHFETTLVFCISFIALMLIRKLLPVIPGIVLLSPFGIALGYASTTDILPLHLETLGSRFGNISTHLFMLPSFHMSQQLLSSALVVAFIAIVETMLSAKIADHMTRTKHNSRKELFGLGLANIASGLVGGIPATAALARTALNIKSGANHKISAALNSIFMALGSLLFLVYFSFMPMAIIAAILVNVAVNMVATEHFARLYTYDKTGFGISLLVAFVTVYHDPIIGVLAGASLSLLFFVEKLSRGYHELTIEHSEEIPEPVSDKQLQQQAHHADVLVYTFKGKLAYINSQHHVLRFENDFSQYSRIILCLRDVYFVDIDGIDALDEIIDLAKKRNQTVLIASVSPHIKSLLKTISRFFVTLKSDGCVFDTTTQALQSLSGKEKREHA